MIAKIWNWLFGCIHKYGSHQQMVVRTEEHSTLVGVVNIAVCIKCGKIKFKVKQLF